LSVYEEFNDNIFLTNARRQSDFITAFSPGVTLAINLPTLQLVGGYLLSGQLYAKESDLSNWVDRQVFLVRAVYLITPEVSLSVYDRFGWDRAADVPGQNGFVVQREESWTNTFTPSLRWLVTPRTTLSLRAGYRVLRFPGGVGSDSDSYLGEARVDYQLTHRLSGIFAYEFSYLRPEGSDDSATHVPRLGAGYLFTPTLSAAVTAGPSITQIRNETILDYVVGANITKVFSMGGASAQYNRGVDTAGAFTGASNVQTVSVSGWFRPTRDFVVAVGAAYNRAESLSGQEAQQTDVHSITANVDLTYQLTQWFSLFAGYNLLIQRTGKASSTQADIDQNRVRVGLTVGYPWSP
jgi:predicted porin